MKNGGVALAIFISVFLVLLVGVYAAESSTRGEDGRYNESIRNESKDNRSEGNKTRYEFQERDCEKLETLRERIRCRIIQGEERLPARNDSNFTEEACRPLNVENKGKCVAFYSTIRTCYNLEGRAKDSCFKRAAGLTNDRLEDQPDENRGEKMRHYMVSVLDNLEDRTEKFQEEGKISDEDAAQIIEKIVLTKQHVLDGENKAKIREDIKELKELWREKITPEVEENES